MEIPHNNTKSALGIKFIKTVNTNKLVQIIVFDGEVRIFMVLIRTFISYFIISGLIVFIFV